MPVLVRYCNDEEAVSTLLQARANPNVDLSTTTTPYGHVFHSPLQVAIARGYSEIAVLLLEAGATPHFDLEYGRRFLKSMLGEPCSLPTTAAVQNNSTNIAPANKALSLIHI